MTNKLTPLFIAVYRHYLRMVLFTLPNLVPLLSRRIFFAGAYPVVRQLTLITGAGSVYLGHNCSLGYKPGGRHHGGMIELQPRYKAAKIVIGNNVYANNNLFVCAAANITIGDNTLIGNTVTIMDFEAHATDPARRYETGKTGEVTIGKNVWIGNQVTILKNSVIGDNSIVATGAVVSGKFPANVIIGGVPARVIKEISAL